MDVRRIGSGRGGRQLFVDLPHRLHRHQPRWVPAMRGDEMRALHFRHPFYRHSEAAFFVAEQSGTVQGRIGVFEHRPANAFHQTKAAHFGYFEASDDPEVAAVLFDAARSWARQRELTSLKGPKGLLPSDGHGILVEGFDLDPVLGVGWHPPYYDRLITSSGLAPAVDYLSGHLDVSHQVPDAVFTAADSALAEGGYEVKTFGSKRSLKPWIHRLGQMYNDAMSGNWEFTPVDDVEIDAMAAQFLPIADPRLVVLLMHGDEVAGYLLILPDVSQAIRASQGRLLPSGWLRLLREVKRTRRVCILAMGLTPHHRGMGANLILYAALARGALKYDFTSAEVVQVEETNLPMMKNLARLGVPWTKRHRMYRGPV